MNKYRLVRSINLGFLGEGWEQAYANFRRPTVADVKQIDKDVKIARDKDNASVLDAIVKSVTNLFLDGKGLSNEGELIDLDVAEMPSDFFYECYTSLLGGEPSPKS